MKKLWKEKAAFRNTCIFLLGFLVGCCFLIVVFGGFGIVKNIQIIKKEAQEVSIENQSAVSENASHEIEDDNVEAEISDEAATTPKDNQTESEEKEEVEEEPQYAGNYSQWNKETVYSGGEFVVYKNHLYKAKWWTQGEEPGTVDVWEDTKETLAEPKEPEESLEDKEINIVNKDVVTDEEFKVVVYYPSWKPYETDKIDYSVVTHVNYAFGIPKADGTLRNLENSSTAKFIIDEAHANKRKVLLAIGGWSYNGTPLEATFVEATNSPEKIKEFGDNILRMCDEYGFDGVDMDWEHPRRDGDSSKQYEELMLYLAEKLHAEGKLLTSAVLSGATADGNIYYDAQAHTDAVLDAVDWVNIMAYDGGDGERHSSYEFAINSGNYWLNTRKMPATKVVLGVPFYARPSWAEYEDILKADPEAYKKDISTFNGMEAHYNGMGTIEKKTDYAKEHYGGIMVWEITQDTTEEKYSLLKAIEKAISKK